MLQNPRPRGGLRGVLGGLPMSEGPAPNPGSRVPVGEQPPSGGLPYTYGGMY